MARQFSTLILSLTMFIVPSLEIQAKESQPKNSDFFAFIEAFYKNSTAIGAIAPSSPFLAKSITECITAKKQSKRILEIGAGTGPFTEKIIAKLSPEDHLDVVEFSSELCDILNAKFKHLKNVTIHCASILDFKSPYKYDFIISGLPLNSFDPDFVEKALVSYRSNLNEKGHIAYFEYIGLPVIKRAYLEVVDKKSAEEFSRTLSLKESFKKEFVSVDESAVLINLPPARVVHCTNE